MSLLNNIRHTFRALSHRNYRLYFAGQSISLTGTWMQQMAIGWLMYRITSSAFLLGLIGFLGQIPTLVFTPFAGVFADRYNRHRILVITQALEMLQALALAALIFCGNISVPSIIALTLFLGVVVAFDAPARHAFVVEMVPKKEDLGNAIALNSLVFNAARLVGPALAGILVAVAGEGTCFLVNGLSYIAVLMALANMRISSRVINMEKRPLIHTFNEAFTYSMKHKTIRSVMLSTALVSLVGMSYIVLMPVFAKDILRSGPESLGLLMGATGLGALSGALFLASRKGAAGLERVARLNINVFGVSLVAFSFSRSLVLSMAILVFAGFGMMAQMASNNTILQTVVHDDKRGRVMSIFMMAFMGTVPFGCLLAGALAAQFGAPRTVAALGALCVISSAIFMRDRAVTRKG